MPLSDASTLYERIALGQVFDSENTRDDFYDLMLNFTLFDDIIDEEAPEGMSESQLGDFKSQVRHCRKGGNWGTSIQSLMGWIELPAPPCNDGTPQGYTFGAFFDDMNMATNSNTISCDILLDDDRTPQHRLDLLDSPLQEALLLLGILIVGVLRQIALLDSVAEPSS